MRENTIQPVTIGKRESRPDPRQPRPPFEHRALAEQIGLPLFGDKAHRLQLPVRQRLQFPVLSNHFQVARPQVIGRVDDSGQRLAMKAVNDDSLVGTRWQGEWLLLITG